MPEARAYGASAGITEPQTPGYSIAIMLSQGSPKNREAEEAPTVCLSSGPRARGCSRVGRGVDFAGSSLP
jgi:hypothetical protein